MKKLILFLVVLNLITFGQTAEEYFKNGFSKYNLKDYSGAIVDYNNAIRLKPDYADAYNNRGVAMYFLKDMNAACSDWSKAGELGSAIALTSMQNYCKQTAEEYYNKGISKYKLEDYTGAIVDFNNAIQLKPDYADAYSYRGVAKHNLQDYTGAITDYNKVIQLNPDNALSYNNRGTSMYYLKDMNGACADWSKAVELGYAEASTYIQNYCKQIVEAAEAQAEAEAKAEAEAEAEAQAARYEAAEESASIIGKPFKLGGFEVAQNDFGTQMEWDQANEACNSLGRGWRLPTEEELNKIYVSLAKKKRGGFSSTIYWSSSLHRDALYNSVLGAKFQDFKISGWGQRDWNAKRNPHSVRAVRTL